MDIRTKLIVDKILNEAVVPGRERLVTAIINMVDGEKPSRTEVRNYLKNINKKDKSWIESMQKRMNQIGGDGGRAFFFSALRRRVANHFSRR